MPSCIDKEFFLALLRGCFWQPGTWIGRCALSASLWHCLKPKELYRRGAFGEGFVYAYKCSAFIWTNKGFSKHCLLLLRCRSFEYHFLKRQRCSNIWLSSIAASSDQENEINKLCGGGGGSELASYLWIVFSLLPLKHFRPFPFSFKSVWEYMSNLGILLFF